MARIYVAFLTFLALCGCRMYPNDTVLVLDKCWNIPRELGNVHGTTRIYYFPEESVFAQNVNCPKSIIYLHLNDQSRAVLNAAYEKNFNPKITLGIRVVANISGAFEKYGRRSEIRINVKSISLDKRYPIHAINILGKSSRLTH